MQYLEEVNINGSLNMVSLTEIGTLVCNVMILVILECFQIKLPIFQVEGKIHIVLDVEGLSRYFQRGE